MGLGVNKRLFGSPMPEQVQKKLETRQKIADKPEVGKQIMKTGVDRYTGIPPVFPGTNPPGGNVGELASRTPFVRMWTAIDAGEMTISYRPQKESDSDITFDLPSHRFMDQIKAVREADSLEAPGLDKSSDKSIVDWMEANGHVRAGDIDLVRFRRWDAYRTNNPGTELSRTEVPYSDLYGYDMDKSNLKHKQKSAYGASQNSAIAHHQLRAAQGYFTDDSSSGTVTYSQTNVFEDDKEKELIQEQVPEGSTIYVVGNHAGSTIPSPNESIYRGALAYPNPPKDADEATERARQEAIEKKDFDFHAESSNNQFLKPRAGITSMDSVTEGSLGAVKRTTVNFEVNNFDDFDKIYNKYFLKPGATIFVDYGWSSSTLYEPKDLINSAKGKNNDYANIKDFLYQTPENGKKVGVIEKNQGDLEVLHGIVSEYSAKFTENGGVQCSVTLVSGNQALLMQDIDEAMRIKIKNILEHAIMYIVASQYKTATIKHSLGSSNFGLKGGTKGASVSSEIAIPNIDMENDTDAAQKQVKYAKKLLMIANEFVGGSNLTPTGNAIRTGVFVDSTYFNNTFISWGFFEDVILNSQFGFGTDEGDINSGENLQCRFNSSDTFVTWSPIWLLRQKNIAQMLNVDDPKIIMPVWWGPDDPDFEPTYPVYQQNQAGGPKFVGSTSPVQQVTNSTGGSYTWQREEQEGTRKYADEEVYTSDAKYFQKQTYMNLDKARERIPLREIFIDTSLIIKSLNAYADGNVEKFVKEVLDRVNKESFGVFDLITVRGQSDSELKIVDSNKLKYQDDAGGSMSSQQINNAFENLFMFNVMSSNSIVVDYDVQFKIASSAIGTMFALQAMSGDDKLDGGENEKLHDVLALTTIDPDHPKIVYQPDLGSFRAKCLESKNEEVSSIMKTYQQAERLVSDGSFSVKIKSHSGNITVAEKTAGFSNKQNKNADDPDHEEEVSIEELIKADMEFLKEQGFKLAKDLTEFYGLLFNAYVTSRKTPVLLPIELQIGLYGISTLQPGDVFRVDYLPEVYVKQAYFQTMRVNQKVDSSGWFTTLETQFRRRPETFSAGYKKPKNLNKICLSPEYLRDRFSSMYDACIPAGLAKGGSRYSEIYRTGERYNLRQYDWFVNAKTTSATKPYFWYNDETSEVFAYTPRKLSFSSFVGCMSEIRPVILGGDYKYIEEVYSFKFKPKDGILEYNVPFKFAEGDYDVGNGYSDDHFTDDSRIAGHYDIAGNVGFQKDNGGFTEYSGKGWGYPWYATNYIGRTKKEGRDYVDMWGAPSHDRNKYFLNNPATIDVYDYHELVGSNFMQKMRGGAGLSKDRAYAPFFAFPPHWKDRTYYLFTQSEGTTAKYWAITDTYSDIRYYDFDCSYLGKTLMRKKGKYIDNWYKATTKYYYASTSNHERLWPWVTYSNYCLTDTYWGGKMVEMITDFSNFDFNQDFSQYID